MPHFTKERLEEIKKTYEEITNYKNFDINYLDMILDTIKETWKYNITGEVENEEAENSTIACYYAMKNISNKLNNKDEKFLEKYKAFMNDLKEIFDKTINIPEEQLSSINITLTKPIEDFKEVAFVEEDGTIKSMAYLRNEKMNEEYKVYTNTFDIVFEQIKERDGKQAILETEQVKKLRSPSISITDEYIKQAINHSFDLDPKKSIKELSSDNNIEVNNINDRINSARNEINDSIQNYASEVIFDAKEMDLNKQDELKNDIFLSQTKEKVAYANLFKQQCGTYLKSKERLDSHGALYKFFLHSFYKKEEAMVNQMKDNLKNSFHLNDDELNRIENARNEIKNNPNYNSNILDEEIRIDTNLNERMKLVNYQDYSKHVYDEMNLLEDVKKNSFYNDLAVQVNQSLYQKTTDVLDKKVNNEQKKNISK